MHLASAIHAMQLSKIKPRWSYWPRKNRISLKECWVVNVYKNYERETEYYIEQISFWEIPQMHRSFETRVTRITENFSNCTNSIFFFQDSFSIRNLWIARDGYTHISLMQIMYLIVFASDLIIGFLINIMQFIHSCVRSANFLSRVISRRFLKPVRTKPWLCIFLHRINLWFYEFLNTSTSSARFSSMNFSFCGSSNVWNLNFNSVLL